MEAASSGSVYSNLERRAVPADSWSTTIVLLLPPGRPVCPSSVGVVAKLLMTIYVCMYFDEPARTALHYISCIQLYRRCLHWCRAGDSPYSSSLGLV